MRVLYVSKIPSPHQLELFAALRAHQDVEVAAVFCAWSEPGRLWGELTLPSGFAVLPHCRLQLAGRDCPIAVGIGRRIRAFGPEVAIVGGYAVPALHRAMAWLAGAGVPWLFWEEFHPLPERSGRPWTRLRRRMLRAALDGCSAVLGIGTRAAAYFRTLTSGAKAVHNFPYASDLSRFCRQERHTVGDRVRFLYVGRLIPEKGLEVLLRAFVTVAREHATAQLALVGDGPLRPRLVEMIPAGLRGRVEFRGERGWSEMPAEYRRADVFVFPTRHDGWGMVVPEAMASGLPVIGSGEGGAVIDLVRDGRTGFVFRKDDEAALAERMRHFCRRPADAVAMGEAARRACRHLDAPAGAEALRRILAAYA